MKFVEPIRSIKKLNEIKATLKSKWQIKNLLLIEHWINSALRISDLLTLKVWDVFEKDWTVKDFYIIKEEKTDKTTKIHITDKVKATLKLYREQYSWVVSKQSNYIFFQSRSNSKWDKPISRQQARKIITKFCKLVWLPWNYWGHTLRKTRGYQARMKWITLPVIQEKLRHSNLAITKRYLGITDDEVRKASLQLDL